MTIPEFREVRVTSRGVRLTPNGKLTAVKVDFIPGDLSPVSTHAQEMAKGLTGWTDFDTVPETVTPVFPKHEDDIVIGESVIRKPVRKIVRVVTAGPTAAHMDARRKAEALAERGRAEARARKASRNAR